MSLKNPVPKFTSVFWQMVAHRVIYNIMHRVQQEHKNYLGQSFKDYSANYSERKSQNKAKPKGMSQQSTSTIPDMTLTGKTMADLQIRSKNDKGIVIGWIGIFGDVVSKLFNKKNYKIVNLGAGDPFSKKEMKIIDDAINKKIDTEIKEYCSKPIILGK